MDMVSPNAEAVPGISFPRETFAKLTPASYLEAHLRQPSPIRPNGRRPAEFRRAVVNKSSLTHTNGSAVVRIGDTAIVCGVRAELLLASDIPHPPLNEELQQQQQQQQQQADDVIEQLGLLVPNVELSTGCSPAHLPGNPPSSLAQALSYRLLSLLQRSHYIDSSSLRIEYFEPKTDDDLPDEEPRVTARAYWALYVDVLCLALDGNAFDAVWLATMAALQDTVLPKAWWDPDQQAILCSPLVSDSSPLKLGSMPLVTTFAVYSTASALKKREGARSWLLADPDTLEEDVCNEMLTIVLRQAINGDEPLLSIEKSGGAVVGSEAIKECVNEASKRWEEVQTALMQR